MGSVLHLESFDAGSSAGTKPHADAPKTAAYQEGYAAGLAQAEAGFIAKQATLRSGVLEAIDAATLTFEAAQSSILSAVMPLLDTMISTLLPATLTPALHAHLRDLVAEALATDASEPLTLTVPPDQEDAIHALFEDVDAPNLQIKTDASLTDNAAWVSAASQETALDLDAALAAIAAHIDDLKTLTTKAEAS